jgi:hypothetical protein
MGMGMVMVMTAGGKERLSRNYARNIVFLYSFRIFKWVGSVFVSAIVVFRDGDGDGDGDDSRRKRKAESRLKWE